MYLVMSLTVTDLLVGSVSGSVDSILGQNGLCPFVKFYPLSSEVRIAFDYLILFFPVVSMTNAAMISLERFHATFRPFRHRLINRWVYVVANYCCLGFSCYSISPGGDRKVSYNTPPLLELVEWHCCLCLIVTFVSYKSILFKFCFGAHPQRHCASALRQRKLSHYL